MSYNTTKRLTSLTSFSMLHLTPQSASTLPVVKNLMRLSMNQSVQFIYINRHTPQIIPGISISQTLSGYCFEVCPLFVPVLKAYHHVITRFAPQPSRHSRCELVFWGQLNLESLHLSCLDVVHLLSQLGHGLWSCLGHVHDFFRALSYWELARCLPTRHFRHDLRRDADLFGRMHGDARRCGGSEPQSRECHDQPNSSGAIAYSRGSGDSRRRRRPRGPLPTRRHHILASIQSPDKSSRSKCSDGR